MAADSLKSSEAVCEMFTRKCEDMPAHAKVLIHYGPYEACGIVEHRRSRLLGLQTVLEKDNHTCDMFPIEDWNVVKLWVNGEMIYQCDIRHLDYGGDGELDELCQAALKAVKKAF